MFLCCRSVFLCYARMAHTVVCVCVLVSVGVCMQLVARGRTPGHRAMGMVHVQRRRPASVFVTLGSLVLCAQQRTHRDSKL